MTGVLTFVTPRAPEGVVRQTITDRGDRVTLDVTATRPAEAAVRAVARATTWRRCVRRCIPTGPDRKMAWRDVNLPACYGISTGLPRWEKQDAWGERQR